MEKGDNLRKTKFSVFICGDKSMISHTHFFLELVYVLKGEAEHFLNGKSSTVKEGEYFVIDFNSEHSYHSKDDDFAIINCIFMPELIDPSLVNCKSFAAVISNYQIHFKNEFFITDPAANIFFDEDKKVRKLLLEMIEEMENEKPGYIQIIRSKLIEILIETMRKIYAAPEFITEDGCIESILKFINQEYANEITLIDICKKFNYSLSYMSKKFKKEAGISFVEFLQKTRIEQSMRLLAHTQKSVCEVAQTVGYCDIKAYYKAFRKIAGTTPANFRKTFKICREGKNHPL